MKKAFTLAEVLITLGIIGIVAAMTMPALMAKFNERVWLTRFKQTYSILTNAYVMASKDYGYSQDWGVGSINETENLNADSELIALIMTKYMKVTPGTYRYYVTYNLNGKQQSIMDSNIHVYSRPYILSNGTTIRFSRPSGLSGDGVVKEYQAGVLVDVNGAQKPNTVGKDIFYLFLVASKPKITGYELWWVNELSCSTTRSQAWTAGGSCATWIIKNGNMDYLHRELTHDEWIK